MKLRNIFSLVISCLFLCNAGKAYNITFRVDMNNVTANFITPQVNGTFNNWCGACFSLTDADGDNIWEGTTNLNAGSYQYKFTYDNWAGQETLTAGSPCTTTSGTFTNRTLTVTGDAVLPVVCWNSCVSCAETPPPPVFYSVTFSLDMSQQSGFGTPEVNGIFNNWCGNCFPMIDSNNDSIYTATTTLQEGSYEYKFSYSNWAGQETLVAGSPCTQTTDIYTNRILQLSSDTVLSPVCWGSCYGCGMEPQEYNVTFRVDMSEQSGFTIPEVNGTFNGWCGNCNPMTDADNDSIWELTVPLIEGMIEYKFSYDNWAGQESLDTGAFCTITSDGFTNRFLNLFSDTVLNLVCFGSCNVCGYLPPPPPSYNVTFLVDMSQQSGFNTPEINGSFNSFCGNCNPLSDTTGNGIWGVTLSLPAGIYTYYYSADSLMLSEDLSSVDPCALTIDSGLYRYIIVSADTILPLVCWGECNQCEATPTYYDVTFQLDISTQNNLSSPEINGSFNANCGNCNALTDSDNNGIWEITLSLPAGNHSYYFSSDSLALIESLNSSDVCAANINSIYYRQLQLSSDTVLPVVCWGSCTQCPLPPVSYSVTFRLDMSQQSGFITPEINGTLNNWCGNCFAMSDPDGDNIWEATTEVTAGSFEYKFSYDNWAAQEQLTEGGSCTVTANGYTNRYLEVDADTILPVVCWGSCTACDSTPPPPMTRTVTFRVDMSQQTGFTTPEVNGTFNNWCGNCFPMSDADGDNIWEATTELEDGAFEYKFSYDNWAGQEQLSEGSSCTVTNSGFTNRYLQLNSDTLLPVVCWSACSACDSTPPPPMTRSVTFRVDMSQQTGFTTPEVNGTFNNWCGNCFPMSDADGDNIWEATTTLAIGAYEYKFSYDNWSGSEQLTAGSICTVTNSGFTNRILNLESDTILNVVCWSSCSSCGSTPPMYSVTFRVDMSQQAGFTTPEVNGTFNNWCGSCFTMSDADGDNIWEASTLLAAGDYQYKFSNDNWTGQESLTPGSICTYTDGTFTNRYLDLVSDTILPVVCWGSCAECQVAQPVSVEFLVDVSGQSFTDNVTIAGNFNNYCQTCDTLMPMGGGLYSAVLHLLPGVYEYYFGLDDGAMVESLNDATCTVSADSGFHRAITVTEATILPEVCWNSCDTCVVATSINQVDANLFVVFPNPANDNVNLRLTSEGITRVELRHISGALVHTCAYDTSLITLPTASLSQGVYIISVSNDLGTERQIIQIIH